jgi:uncharacterized protein DUF2568
MIARKSTGRLARGSLGIGRRAPGPSAVGDNGGMMAGLNLALRFLLELAGIVALGWWGFHASGNTLIAILLGVGAPVVLIVVWALFVAPRAVYRQPPRTRLIVGTILLELTAIALAISGPVLLAAILAVLIALNAAALVVTGAEDPR